ncbi:SIDT1 [Symbiodinium sp. KB8]|nr:SIDT1 [Symbiodinium sp. KB8]
MRACLPWWLACVHQALQLSIAAAETCTALYDMIYCQSEIFYSRGIQTTMLNFTLNVTFSPPIFIADLSVYARRTHDSHEAMNSLPVHADVLVAESFLSFPTQRDTLRGKFLCNFHDPVSDIIVMPQSTVQQRSYRLSAGLVAKQINPQTSETPAQRININRPGVVAFDITEDMVRSGEQSLEIRAMNYQSGSMEIFLFPADGNDCMDFEIRKGSTASKCVSVRQLADCLSSQKISDIVSYNLPRSIRFTVKSEGRVVLSRWSALPLSEGLWFVLLMPDGSDRFVTYEVAMRGARPRPTLSSCALAMWIIPVVAVLLFQALDLHLKRTWHAWRGSPRSRRPCLRLVREWCLLDADFRTFLWQMADDSVRRGSHAAIICVSAGCFFLAAIQLAMGIWAGQRQAGSLDICRYNFECYVPFGLDLPFNNMLSHIPYFVTGVLSVIIVAHTDYNLTIQAEADGEPKPPDLRFFYALSWCLVLEGFGSTCYHVCPTSYLFQFDSAMMFVIAVLSTVCLLDGSDEEQRDPVSMQSMPSMRASERFFTPVVLMLLITVPMWTISFVGTWFDFVVPESVHGAISYNLYCAAVLLWFLFILLKVQHAFPDYRESGSSSCCGRSKALAVTRVLTWGLVAVMLFLPAARIQFGGMSNVLLFLSMLVMVFVIGRQMLKRDRSRRGSISLDDSVRWLSKFGLLFLFLLTSFVALHFFNTTMTDVLVSAAESRTFNKDCIFMGTFDAHDVWHMSSAISLALWVQVFPRDISWHALAAGQAAMQASAQRGRLLLTDVDRLEARGLEQTPETRTSSSVGCNVDASEGSLVLSCILPPSSYFTVAFRELTRQTQTSAVDASFAQLSPQDLAALQLRLSQTDASSRKPLERLLGSIQKAMEARMEMATKEIEALMQSSGNIDDNIRECLQRQDSVLPIMAVLQMNIGRAQKAGNQQLEKALTYLYNIMNQEIESKVPMVNRVLSRCLSTEDSDARRELLAAYFAETAGEEEAAKRPKSTASAIVGLVSEAQAQATQPGLDLTSALQRIRGVALDAGVVLGEVFDDKVQERFMEDIQPLFDALAETNHSQTQHRRSNRVTSKSCSSRLLDMCEVSSSNNARADSGGPHDHLACSQSRTRSHAHASDIVRCP